MTDERKPLYTYVSPSTWPVWIGMGLLRLICLLPLRISMAIGRSLGRLAHALTGTRRAIVRRNIELCFPDLSIAERNAMAKAHFLALGMGLIETGLCRWATDATHLKIGRLDGVEHLEAALATGRGIIFLSAHFTTIEIMGRVLALHAPRPDAVYRKNRSEFITEIQRTGRERMAESTIEKRDIKATVRSLRSGRSVWYAPDQSYDRKGAAVIEFFGVPCMHTTATSSLARLGKAIVLPFYPRRLDDGTYVHTFYPPHESIPSGDEVADTREYVRVLEEHVRKCPEQYFWLHRKFKNLPEGYPDYYADLDAAK